MSKDTAAIRDQLGKDGDVVPNVVIGFDETVGIEEGPTTISTSSIGESFIFGSTTNGILGTNTASTQSGNQQVLGSSGRATATIAIVNPNNTFNENFIDTSFNSTSTTADWGTATAGELQFTSGEVAQSTTIAKTGNNFTNAKLITTLSTGTLTGLTLKLTSDGTNYETATDNELHNFTNIGQDLRFQITAASTATITKIKVEYNNG